MKETEIQSSIIDFLTIQENQGKLFFSRLNNIPPVEKTSTGMKFRRMPKGSKKGIPDILVLKSGRTIALEIKTKIGKQSKEQKEIEKHFTKQGAEYYIIRDFYEVIEILCK
ncbi:MAG: VRR-NUC domain-containing protein [Cetobacterium sp.]|nr:VRR-NUC domain-containing protein [Cetobacterium sp.]